MPETAAGRALLTGTEDALGITSESANGTHGEQYRERFHEAIARNVDAIEAEARALGRTEALAAVRAAVLPLLPDDPSGDNAAEATARAAIDNLETPHA